jgi:deoxycytidine triphosphate deaminase
MALIAIKDQIADDPEKFEKFKKSDSSVIYTTALKIEEFSIELSVGDRWAEELSKEAPQMYSIENEAIEIKPKSSIIIQTLEFLCVPNNMYGLIMPTGSLLLQQGIFIANTKIEPSFNGKFEILLYNSSNCKRVIKKGQFVASAIFFRTEKTTNLPPITKDNPPIKKHKKLYQKIYSSIKADPKFVILIISTILTSSLAAAFFSYFMIQNVAPQKDDYSKGKADSVIQQPQKKLEHAIQPPKTQQGKMQ